jgi:uncharacterized protein YecE (DUF72 family)
MLRHYSREFPLVELNFTFYRPPTPEMLSRLADQAAPGFQFWVKLPRSLSHDEKTDDLDSFREAVETLRRRGQLLGVLCQLPQATHREQKHVSWLDRLAYEMSPYGLAVEFRHHSWSDPEVPRWLAERKVDLVSVDAPDLPGLYPSGPVHSCSTMYVRFHSRNGRNWYQSDKQRYDYSFSNAELGLWIEHLRRESPVIDKAFLLFNNCHRANAPLNARRMKELLARTAPELVLTSPAPSVPEPTQQLMFE